MGLRFFHFPAQSCQKISQAALPETLADLHKFTSTSCPTSISYNSCPLSPHSTSSALAILQHSHPCLPTGPLHMLSLCQIILPQTIAHLLILLYLIPN